MGIALGWLDRTERLMLVQAEQKRLVFFFQAEDGIRDADVTGVQTCALPISFDLRRWPARRRIFFLQWEYENLPLDLVKALNKNFDWIVAPSSHSLRIYQRSGLLDRKSVV